MPLAQLTMAFDTESLTNMVSDCTIMDWPNGLEHTVVKKIEERI